MQDGSRLVFFRRISRFLDISAFSVAIHRHACRVLATIGLIAVAGCATPPQPAPSAPAQAMTADAKQALVAQRAAKRWEAMVKDDLDAAYGYMSPGSRDATSLEKYKANTRRGAFREGKIESVSCDGDACVVKVMVTYDHPKMKGITTPVVESWIIDGNQAWYVYGAR
jgi:hypothetical protein